MLRTKTDDVLAASEIQHSHDPERAELIARVRRFKASWFELGEALTEIKRSEGYKKWGHASFEDYCKKELHLKRETADKLTGSFVFLRAKAPEVLRRDGRDAPIPAYQAVDFLRRAEEESNAPEETLTELRRHVLDEGTPLAKISRIYREAIFPRLRGADGEAPGQYVEHHQSTDGADGAGARRPVGSGSALRRGGGAAGATRSPPRAQSGSSLGITRPSSARRRHSSPPRPHDAYRLRSAL